MLRKDYIPKGLKHDVAVQLTREVLQANSALDPCILCKNGLPMITSVSEGESPWCSIPTLTQTQS
jgi:hypothetical protein